MTFYSEANAKFCLDFFRRLRRDRPAENILFSPLNMSAALHLLHYGSQGDSAAEIEKALHLTDEKEHLSPESRENSEETTNCNAPEAGLTASFTNDLHDNTEAPEECITDAEDDQDGTDNTEAPEECITDAEDDQDGTGNTEAPEECITDAEDDQDGTDNIEAPEECITDAEDDQDGTAQSLAEDCEEKERPSALDLLQSHEEDSRQIDRSLAHTSISTDSQSTSTEGASASFLSGSKNIPSEGGVDILSHEQPSPEGVASHKLVNTSENQDVLVTERNTTAEETRIISDNSDVDTENIHNSSCIDPGNHVNGEDTETRKGISSLDSHLVSEADNEKPVTESHSAQSREGTSPQSDTVNVVPRGEDDKFLSQEQSSQEDNQDQVKSPESHRESMTFSDGGSPSFDAHSEAARDKLLKDPFHEYRHDINTTESKNTVTENRISPPFAPPSDGINEAMNDSVQTLENNSSRCDSDEDASTDFLPWSADYPEKEDEMSQGWSAPEDNVFDDQISSPTNKQALLLNTSDATNPEGATRLNDDHIKKLNMTNEESEGEEGNALPDAKPTHRNSDHNRGYSVSSAEFAISSYDLPWYRYLIGRAWREAVRLACYPLLESLIEPLESRMYNYLARSKKCPPGSE